MLWLPHDFSKLPVEQLNSFFRIHINLNHRRCVTEPLRRIHSWPALYQRTISTVCLDRFESA